MQLSGSSAFVTGAASGLGAATVALLAASGVHVTGFDLPAAAAAPAVAPPDGVNIIGGDVTSEEDVLAALATVDAAHPLRLVVNCAGIAPARRILSSKGAHDLASFQKTIAVNLVGTFNVMRLAAAAMAENEPIDGAGQRGVIVNTASVAAYEGQIGQIAYSASKGGVVAMTITAARDLARNGIRVNTIAPGIIDTPLLAALGPEVNASLAASVPFPARLGQPGEYAQLVVMLAEHDYLNGETIRMDGAIRMAPQ
ncbi:MAG: SDR family oxidoreductase [Acidobacteria bacterium]|nr:SDR family oxidoreductase [Acidobacteriota bacterium]